MLLSTGITKRKIFPYKIKSDRINALRKQYDAFLEEDKKRKERNEYILGRLDKMRYSNALVPTRYKPIALLNGPTLGIYRGRFPEYAIARDYPVPIDNKNHTTSAMPHTNLDDESLIQEITKKFILIPRSDGFAQNIQSGPNLEFNLIKDPAQNITTPKDATSTTSNTDWKSKYEILNILKKEEPSKLSASNDLAGPNANNEAILSNVIEQHKNDSYDNPINMPDENIFKYLDEKPEKDTDYVHNVTNTSNTYDEKETANVTAESITTDSAIPICNIVLADPITTIDHQVESMKLDNSDVHNMTYEVVHQDYKISPETDTTTLYDNQPPLQNLEDNYENVTTKTEIINNEADYSQYNQNQIGTDESSVPSTLYTEKTSNAYDDTVESPNNYLSNDATKQTDKVENIQYYAQNEDFIKHDVPDQQREEEDSELYKNQSQNDVDGFVEPVEITTEDDSQNDSTVVYQEYPEEEIQSAIQEFEREQVEMFYSEQTGDEYQQELDYNQDYTPQVQENQDYTYYEGAQPVTYEEQHIAEINENEDVTQRYDQHYEQQYVEMNAGDNSGNLTENVSQQDISHTSEQTPQEPVYVQEGDYENYKPTADYNQSQYGIPEGADQTQLVYEQVDYEQNYENQQQIQQVLDTEDGYNFQTSDTKQDLSKEQPIVA